MQIPSTVSDILDRKLWDGSRKYEFLLSVPGDSNSGSPGNPPFEKHWTSHCKEWFHPQTIPLHMGN